MEPLPAGISPILPQEYPEVVTVWEASVRATHHFVSEADIVYFRDLIPTFLPAVAVLLGTHDAAGGLTGFIGVTPHESVEMLFIHPAWRGRGIGKQLFHYAITTLGAHTLDVNEQNEQAVGFYLAMGFEVSGRAELDDHGKPYPLLHMRQRKA